MVRVAKLVYARVGAVCHLIGILDAVAVRVALGGIGSKQVFLSVRQAVPIAIQVAVISRAGNGARSAACFPRARFERGWDWNRDKQTLGDQWVRGSRVASVQRVANFRTRVGVNRDGHVFAAETATLWAEMRRCGRGMNVKTWNFRKGIMHFEVAKAVAALSVLIEASHPNRAI